MTNLSFICTRSSLYPQERKSVLTCCTIDYSFFLLTDGYKLSLYTQYCPIVFWVWWSRLGGTSQGNIPYLSTVLHRNSFFQVSKFILLFLSLSYLLSVMLHTVDCLFSFNIFSSLSVLPLTSSCPLSLTPTLLFFDYLSLT